MLVDVRLAWHVTTSSYKCVVDQHLYAVLQCMLLVPMVSTRKHNRNWNWFHQLSKPSLLPYLYHCCRISVVTGLDRNASLLNGASLVLLMIVPSGGYGPASIWKSASAKHGDSWATESSA